MIFRNESRSSNLLPKVTLRKVREAAHADPRCVQLTLFKGTGGRVCGWYIGPLSIGADRIEMPYLAPTDDTLAAVAFVRALAAANFARTSVCVIDPEDLWGSAWHD